MKISKKILLGLFFTVTPIFSNAIECGPSDTHTVCGSLMLSQGSTAGSVFSVNNAVKIKYLLPNFLKILNKGF